VKADRFEELKIWQCARILVPKIYSLFGSETSGGMDFGFRNQITRAAVSVMNNIAEGFERKTDADFAHFLDVAKASSGEVRSMLYAAEDLGYINSQVAVNMRAEYENLSRGIAKLTSYLRIKKN
jgi:four helix bundle protein